MDIRIEQPIWFLLLIPFIVYFIYSWKVAGYRFFNKLSILFYLRTATILLLIFALTSPYMSLTNKKEQVLFLIDRSASIETMAPQVEQWIVESLKYRKDHQSVGIYSFADEFRTDLILTEEEIKVPEMDKIKNSSKTNIAKAIDLATTAAQKNVATRLVLFSDGLDTEGGVEESIANLQQDVVQIDTVILEREQASDVSIEMFESPTTAYEGERQLLKVDVYASHPAEGQLLISRNDQTLIDEPVQLEKGMNTFHFETKAIGSGLLKYEAKVIVGHDSFLQNNRMTSITMLDRSPKVLVVETEKRSSVIPSLIDQSSVGVEVITAENLPEQLSSYLQYGGIIFDNVPGHLVGEKKMSVIEQAVKHFGVGFMMVGGEESFGLGGYFQSPIEKLLPVEMEIKSKERLPSLGLVIILDRSGSMSGSKITLAREAAVRSVELLRDEDTFGFTAFDDRPWEIIPVGALTDKEEAIEKILSVSPGGGTNLFPSLQKAYEDLSELELQQRHIILLTDGQSAAPTNFESMVEEGKRDLVTLTTVAIGADADHQMLEMLASIGGGRYYQVLDETMIPSILTRETSLMTRTYIEDDPFYMSLYGSVPEWSSLFTEGVPEMNAYIATTPKSTATIIAETPKEDPLLAQWTYGLGKTIAFTSDATGKWSGDLAKWERFPDFWNVAVSQLLPNYDEVPFMVTHEQGSTYTVTDSSQSSAFMDVVAINEDGKEVPLKMDPIGPGKTRVTIDSDEPGLVFFGIQDDQGRVFETGVSIPYGEEYKQKDTDTHFMRTITEVTDGKILQDPADVFRPHPFKSEERLPIHRAVILLAMLLFFIDITLRRFGLLTKRTDILSKTMIVQEQQPVEDEQDHVTKLLKARKKR